MDAMLRNWACIGAGTRVGQAGVNLVTGLERRARRRGDDNACDVVAHHLRKGEGEGGMEHALAHGDLDGVRAGGPDLDQRIVGARDGVIDLSEGDHRVVAISSDVSCAHFGLPRARPVRPISLNIELLYARLNFGKPVAAPA